MKKMIKTAIVMVALLTTLLTGGVACGEQKTVEDRIMQEASIQSKKVFSGLNLSKKLIVEKKEKYFLVYPEGMKRDCSLKVLINDFYENKPFAIPEIGDELDFPEKQQSYLSDAKEAIIKYIDDSNVIKAEDKEMAKEAVQNVTVCYAEFQGIFKEGYPMVTDKSTNTIYVNASMEDIHEVYLYIHELVHVVSNATNAGSTYEYSTYRGNRLNEVITDLIAREIAEVNDFKITVKTTYIDYCTAVYPVISKYNLLDVYYYSEGYAQCISNKFDVYVISLMNFESDPANYTWILDFLLNDLNENRW